MNDLVADYERHTKSDPGIYEYRQRELFTNMTQNISVVVMEDFTLCKLLGEGAFGKVKLILY